MKSLAAAVVLIGCAHPVGPPLSPDRSVVVDGKTRTYHVHVPAGPAPAKRPALIAFHGHGSTGRAFTRRDHFVESADAHGFVFVAGDGLDRAWADARYAKEAIAAGVDDVAFTRAMIDRLVAEDDVDPARIYVTGFSNGAMFVYSLACGLADRVAGVAAVSGEMPSALEATCATGKPVPMLVVHGDADPIVPYDGAPFRLLSVDATARYWATRDGCAAQPVEAPLVTRDVDDGTAVKRLSFAGCAGGATVDVITVEHGGHTWPGGDTRTPESDVGKTTGRIDMVDVIWQLLMSRRND